MEAARKHRFTVEEYHRMGETGIISEDDRVELIDGEVVEMSPIGSRHMQTVTRLNRLLSHWTFDSPQNDALFVSVQNPLVLAGDDEPQTDLVLLRRSGDRSGAFSSEEALLVVEVSDTSLRHDRETKLPSALRLASPRRGSWTSRKTRWRFTRIPPSTVTARSPWRGAASG